MNIFLQKSSGSAKHYKRVFMALKLRNIFLATVKDESNVKLSGRQDAKRSAADWRSARASCYGS